MTYETIPYTQLLNVWCIYILPPKPPKCRYIDPYIEYLEYTSNSLDPQMRKRVAIYQDTMPVLLAGGKKVTVWRVPYFDIKTQYFWQAEI